MDKVQKYNSFNAALLCHEASNFTLDFDEILPVGYKEEILAMELWR
jgi:hypothetical protein